MADSIPDLWSAEIGLDVLPPATILNTQAAIIQKRTKGVIVAELIQRKYKNVIELYFDLKGQAARHRSRLLVCRYVDEQVYPVWVTSQALIEAGEIYENPGLVELPFRLDPEEIRATAIAHEQQDFMATVSTVFNSPSVKSRISSMIAKSNESKQPLDFLIVEEDIVDTNV